MKKMDTLTMPAEWAPHDATWLAWPHNIDTWPGKPIHIIEKTWVDITKALSPYEKVRINVNDDHMEKHVFKLLEKNNIDLNQIEFFKFPTNDCWIRDHGPLFVKSSTDNRPFILNSEFNMWGGKYPPWNLDNGIPQKIATALQIDSINTNIVLEGGSIDLNGQGSLLTSESCLLNKNRNPHLDKSQIENLLEKFLGARDILWVEDGIVGDDTDGHIDDITRFTDSETIVTAIETNRNDANYELLKNNLQKIEGMTDIHGKSFRVETLPMPTPLFDGNERIPASYANFYIANKTVLVPIFKDRNDEKAQLTLEKLFPDRNIVGIDSRNLVCGLGGIHCVTQQQPKYTNSSVQ